MAKKKLITITLTEEQLHLLSDCIVTTTRAATQEDYQTDEHMMNDEFNSLVNEDDAYLHNGQDDLFDLKTKDLINIIKLHENIILPTIAKIK